MSHPFLTRKDNDTFVACAPPHSCPFVPAEAEGMLDSETDDEPAEVDVQISLPYETGAHLRPGIVHRLDKGTTGVLLPAWGTLALLYCSNWAVLTGVADQQ